MLKIDNITKSYRKGGTTFTALENVTLTVNNGEFVSVVGPSGSGKSTLLHITGGLIHPDSGRVLFNGKDIYTLSRNESNDFRSRAVGFVFQQFHLIPYLTVYENIKMVCREPKHRQRIEDYMDTCSLLPLRNKYPTELSVGEKQRTAFIRAIIKGPDLLLADEPTGNLDPLNSSILMSLMEQFNRNGGTVLLVSHDPDSSRYANRHVTIDSGRLTSDREMV
jgi:putative ABC transport system ATP-binding protein